MLKPCRSGFSLLELLVVVAIIGITTSIAVSSLLGNLERNGLKASAQSVQAHLQHARIEAEAMSQDCALKFLQGRGKWQVALYRDENRNGVRNEEIASGIDRLISGPEDLLAQPSIARVGFPAGILPDPDGGRPLDASSSPIAFTNSRLCTFAPDGRSSPGSVYLTVGDSVCVIRTSGSSGLITVLFFDRRHQKWLPL